jgi:hypothetical protein
MNATQTETLYEVLHEGSPLGIGTREELLALSDDGILPPRDELVFKLVGTFAA